jgi:hypothetical protein
MFVLPHMLPAIVASAPQNPANIMTQWFVCLADFVTLAKSHDWLRLMGPSPSCSSAVLKDSMASLLGGCIWDASA